MKIRKTYLFIILLSAITAYSLFMYISSQKERYQLLDTLSQAQGRAQSLEQENGDLRVSLAQEKEQEAKLVRENTLLKGGLKAGKQKIGKLHKQVQNADAFGNDLKAQFTLVKTENEILRKDRDEINSKFSQTVQENESLKVKLSSIAELKKAIREVKKQMRGVAVSIFHKVEAPRIIGGNGGYIIRNGKPTSPPKIKIEVKPVSEK
ncbi:MAG TPA: hypothetical protein PKL77_02455 [Candidatus Omnitrophota bacterium]|nr:hypothetical protein [Candidatus Omnitrophota bacterium]HPT07021.1 hypothetical protein [Candidatus Omnitrophota bacterium]